jgi:hypothetical protein
MHSWDKLYSLQKGKIDITSKGLFMEFQRVSEIRVWDPNGPQICLLLHPWGRALA